MSATTRSRISSLILADDLDRLTGGICQLPVLVARPVIDRTGVAAAHRDDDIGRPDDLVGPAPGLLGGDIDADLAHRLDRRRVDRRCGLRATGENLDAIPGEMS